MTSSFSQRCLPIHACNPLIPPHPLSLALSHASAAHATCLTVPNLQILHHFCDQGRATCSNLRLAVALGGSVGGERMFFHAVLCGDEQFIHSNIRVTHTQQKGCTVKPPHFTRHATPNPSRSPPPPSAVVARPAFAPSRFAPDITRFDTTLGDAAPLRNSDSVARSCSKSSPAHTPPTALPPAAHPHPTPTPHQPP